MPAPTWLEYLLSFVTWSRRPAEGETKPTNTSGEISPSDAENDTSPDITFSEPPFTNMPLDTEFIIVFAGEGKNTSEVQLRTMLDEELSVDLISSSALTGEKAPKIRPRRDTDPSTVKDNTNEYEILGYVDGRWRHNKTETRSNPVRLFVVRKLRDNLQALLRQGPKKKADDVAEAHVLEAERQSAQQQQQAAQAHNVAKNIRKTQTATQTQSMMDAYNQKRPKPGGSSGPASSGGQSAATTTK